MASIIIPAHNEEFVIEETVESALTQIDDGDEIIVVVNGSTDNTESVIEKYLDKITILVTSIPSKTNALNIGDEVANSFPRIYMDADIVLSGGALHKIKSALANDNTYAVSPEPVMRMHDASWFVKAYYDIWLSLPYCQNGMIGSGVYGLSEEGRKRFNNFPDIIADDGFVRALFNENERSMVKGAYAYVNAPKSLKWLLKIKVRSRLGQYEFMQQFPELIVNEDKDYKGGIRSLLIHPLKWPKVAIYTLVTILTRIIARKKIHNISSYEWEKDMSTRNQKL